MTELTTGTPWIHPETGQVMKRLELHLTYTCPERCTFCSEEHRMDRYKRFPVTWGRVARVLREQAARGVDSVHLTGGEPTIHKRFVDVLKLAKRLGMRTSVGTIGTMLSRPGFAEEALPYLDEALFSLHGPDAATHDRETRREGSFERVTTAMRRVREVKPDFGLFVNSVMTVRNVRALPDTALLAGELGAKLMVVSNLTPEGGADERFAELCVPLKTLAEVLPTVPARAPDTILRFFGVPMCLLGDHWTLSNDLHWDPRVTVEWQTMPGKVVFDGIYNWAPDRKRVHVDACGSCARRGVCTGVFDRFAADHDLTALRPIGEAA